MPQDRFNLANLSSGVFRWLGVVCTAFTLFSNFQSVVAFSDFVRSICEGWREIVKDLINLLLGFFHLEIEEHRAVMIFAILSCLLVSLSAQQATNSSWTKGYRAFSWVSGALFGGAYFSFVVLSTIAVDPRMEDEVIKNILISTAINFAFLAPVFMFNLTLSFRSRIISGIVFFLSALLFVATLNILQRDQDINVLFQISMYLAFITFSSVAAGTYYFSNPKLMAERTLAIGVIISSALVLNWISVFIEHVA